MTTATSREAVHQAPPQPREGLDESRWARTGAAAGFAFVALGVFANFLPGIPPASDASAATVAAYFRDHSGAIKGQQLVGALGIAALFWWFGALWRILSRAEGERPRLAIVAGVSIAAGLTLAMVGGAVSATAALRVDSVVLAHLLWSLSLVAFAIGGLGIGTFLIATCVVTYRSRVAPRWTSYLGWAAALAFFVGAGGVVSDGSAVNTFGLVAFLVWCAWILAMSAVMWRGATSSVAV